ncbi:formimidoylglutamate deiminase [Lapillicoccus sp.]|uniref:formimidoylglutamate deiminase n=1 Tax=Lapillicoccus sp. TaxID=1909287 RepID=UPI0032660C23
MTQTTYWAEHAWLSTGPAAGVRLSVEAGRFVRVEPRVHAHSDDLRLAGVVLPGLANTHSHAFHRALRGRTHGGAGDFWSWREQMYAVTRRLDPDTYLALARATYAEMALAGTTVVGEFHYLHHDVDGRRYSDPNAMSGALVAAAAEAGLRITLLDTCYLAGGLNGNGYLPPDRVQQRFSDGTVDAWWERMSDFAASFGTGSRAKVRFGAAIHSVRAVPRPALETLGALVADMPLHVHLSEQPAENMACEIVHGCSPTRLLADTGVLRPDLTAVHATHLSADDVKLLGSADAQAAFCPTTERDLADGIGPARELSDAGVSLSLGSDQHAVIDPFEEVRGLEMHERLVTNERGRFRPDELLRAASANGYRSLGWFGGGVLAPGALADFVVVRDDTVRTVGSKAGQILYAATASDVAMVVVGGDVIVERGEHVRLGSIAPLLRDAFDALRDDR